jgi:hypothetical protein
MRKSNPVIHSQSGGITIMVTLMMLVFLTITAVGMSRNSIRQTIISGTARQGAMARNIGDSGVEWSILYIDSIHHPASSGSEQAFQNVARTLLEEEINGIPYDIASQAPMDLASFPNTATPPADLQVPAGSGNGFNIALTRMGKAPTDKNSPSPGQAEAGGKPPTKNPDLWCLRSDAQINAGVQFVHSKEAWIKTPLR